MKRLKQGRDLTSDFFKVFCTVKLFANSGMTRMTKRLASSPVVKTTLQPCELFSFSVNPFREYHASSSSSIISKKHWIFWNLCKIPNVGGKHDASIFSSFFSKDEINPGMTLMTWSWQNTLVSSPLYEDEDQSIKKATSTFSPSSNHCLVSFCTMTKTTTKNCNTAIHLRLCSYLFQILTYAIANSFCVTQPFEKSDRQRRSSRLSMSLYKEPHRISYCHL